MAEATTLGWDMATRLSVRAAAKRSTGLEEERNSCSTVTAGASSRSVTSFSSAMARAASKMAASDLLRRQASRKSKNGRGSPSRGAAVSAIVFATNRTSSTCRAARARRGDGSAIDGGGRGKCGRERLAARAVASGDRPAPPPRVSPDTSLDAASRSPARMACARASAWNCTAGCLLLDASATSLDQRRTTSAFTPSRWMPLTSAALATTGLLSTTACFR